ncbi:MAG: chalcone isomerase family protein [Bdellovibrionia bacterium]
MIENVTIAKSATAKIADRNLTLQTVGAGIRAKKVAVVNVKVYVTQLMLSDSAHYVRTDAGALDSASTSPSSALKLDFLRAVDAQTVQLAFRDSLVANQVDLNDTGIKAFLDAVSAGGDAAQGKALTIVLEHLPTGQEAVTYEDNAGKATTVVGGQGLIRKILSIWLGKPADSGLNNLKKSLIEGN